jgi:predicted DNA helicase
VKLEPYTEVKGALRTKKFKEVPDTEISIGDLVMISKNNPLDDNNPTGTVAEKTNYSITVVFEENPVSFIYDKKLRMDLYVNDITFQRMLDSLEKLKTADGRLKVLSEKLLGESSLEWKEDNYPELEWVNQKLNTSQKKAVTKSIEARDFYLIQGPPGTGKTMTAIEIINQAIKQDKAILATADSNIAVDNLVERLAGSGAGVLRLGHPVRVTPLLRQHTLDYKVLDHDDYKKAKKLREKAYKLIDQQENYIHPGGKYRRGMSNEQIKENARKNKRARGVSPSEMKKMAKWLELQDQINKYFRQIERLEDKAVNDLIDRADVICATTSTSGSEIMQDRNFDLVVIDEATQSTEPGALIPLVKGDKTVLIGDHKQLPPTILSQKVAESGLSISLFERLLGVHGIKFWTLLQEQYRMNDKIMNFSNQQFYDNMLKSAKDVAAHDLSDLGIKFDQNKCFTEKALDPSAPVVFFDTTNMEAEERSLPGSYSYDNPVEAEIILDILDEALRSGIDPRDIAVISPYKDQVCFINNREKNKNLEINTVDGFQGREKEMILLSLVRSNPQKNIGFLRDVRRLNVSLTRAKRKLVLIGDSKTIADHDIYNELIEYIKAEGLYYSL